jgi:hypothetical protein
MMLLLKLCSKPSLEDKFIGDDWIMVSQNDFDSFRIDCNNMLSLSSNAPPNISATIAAKATSAAQYSPRRYVP